jgi:hypothetical protein
MKPYTSQSSPIPQKHGPEGKSVQARLHRWAKSIPDHMLIIWGIVLLPLLFILLFIGFFELLPIAGYNIAVRAESYHATPTPFQPRQITPTPFQPLAHPTQTFAIASGMHSAEPTPTPSTPPFLFHGLNFEPGQSRINLRISPPVDTINNGQPILMSFLPGDTCMFSDGFGCVQVLNNLAGGRIIFITLHSGVGGEAQAFRHAVEGTYMGIAGFSLEKTTANLTALIGAEAGISQGGLEDNNLVVEWLTRLPAALVKSYFDRPVPEALAFAMEHDPGLTFIETTPDTWIVFETCGWRIPEEPWPAGHPDTSGAVYIGVIGVYLPVE